jgi:hypothetical protein
MNELIASLVPLAPSLQCITSMNLQRSYEHMTLSPHTIGLDHVVGIFMTLEHVRPVAHAG